MPAPTEVITWSTDTNFTNGVDAGTPTKVEPSTGVKNEGHVPGTPLPAQRINWWQNAVAKWIAWLEAERDAHEEFLGLLETSAADHESRLDSAETKLGGASGSGEWVYPSGRTRQVFHSIADAILDTDAAGAPAWNVSGGNANAPVIEDAVLRFRLRLPSGATLTGVDVQIQTSNSRSGADRFSASVSKRVFGDWSGAGAAPTITALGSPVDDGGANGRYVISITGLSHTVDNSTGDVYVTVTGPSGGAATSSDLVAGCRATFTDPGPRNY